MKIGNKGFLVASIALLVIAIQTVSCGGIGLDVDPRNIGVELGSTATYNITVYNYQDQIECFDITVIPGSCDADWFDWWQNEEFICISGKGQEQVSLNVTPNEEGEFKFKVEAASSNGLSKASQEVRITANLGPIDMPEIINQPPIDPCLSYPTPNGDPELATGTSIKFTASAVDPDGDSLYYRYRLKGPTTKWKSSDDNVISYLDADKYNGQKKTVEGTIVKTYKYIGGNIIFLNFHDPYQGYFTAVIWSSDWDKFPFAPEVYYKGKEVRVTGEIIEYKGSPEIVVRDPSQIEVAYTTNNSWAIMRDWGTDNTWTWKTDIADIGDNKISMWIRDTHHEPTDSYDLEIICDYSIS